MTKRVLRGGFEKRVLMAVLKLKKEAYGMAVKRELENRAERASIGAVYTALDRLEKKGFVKSEWGEPTPQRGGRAKKFFEITSEGARALETARKRDLAMWEWEPAMA